MKRRVSDEPAVGCRYRRRRGPCCRPVMASKYFTALSVAASLPLVRCSARRSAWFFSWTSPSRRIRRSPLHLLPSPCWTGLVDGLRWGCPTRSLLFSCHGHSPFGLMLTLRRHSRGHSLTSVAGARCLVWKVGLRWPIQTCANRTRVHYSRLRSECEPECECEHEAVTRIRVRARITGFIRLFSYSRAAEGTVWRSANMIALKAQVFTLCRRRREGHKGMACFDPL